jgi:hypothetical protein
MSKTLVIGHFAGYSEIVRASEEYVHSMVSVGMDVVIRDIYGREIRDRYLYALGKGDISDAEYCLQCVHNEEITPTKLFKLSVVIPFNTGYSRVGRVLSSNLSQFDEVIVPNRFDEDNLKHDGFVGAIKVIPKPYKVSCFDMTYENITIPNDNSQYRFYYMGDVDCYDGLYHALKAFHSEFDVSESVGMVICFPETYPNMIDAVTYKVNEISGAVKTALSADRPVERFQKEICVFDKLSYEQRMAMHKYCDNFVSGVENGSSSTYAFEAMGMGNKPICGRYGSAESFITEGTGYAVPGVILSELGGRNLFSPDEKHMSTTMRSVFEKRNGVYDPDLRQECTRVAKSSSREKVGNMLKGVFHERG